MAIITVNKRANFGDIVVGVQSGSSCSYITDIRNSAIVKQAIFANQLNVEGEKAFIEVKFRSKYSEREMRLEVVSVSQNHIFIYKFSKCKRFDRDAINLSRLIKEIDSMYRESEYVFVGSLLFSNDTELDPIRETLDNMGLKSILIKKF